MGNSALIKKFTKMRENPGFQVGMNRAEAGGFQAVDVDDAYIV